MQLNINPAFGHKQSFKSGKTEKKSIAQQKTLTVPQETTEQGNKKGLSFKKITNILGVAAWIGMAAYSTKKLDLLNPKSYSKLASKADKASTKTLSMVEKCDTTAKDIINALSTSSKKGARNMAYKIGDGFNGIKSSIGSELFNNLLYAFGTLVVMPLVVLFSPIGKKNSSKDDKISAVVRQPISVAAILGMQFTFDKLISKYVPEAMKQNLTENKNILDDKGKIKLFDKKGKFSRENFDQIKYNKDAAVDGYKKMFDVSTHKGGLKGTLNKSEVAQLFAARTYDSGTSTDIYDKLKDVLNAKYGKNKKIDNIFDMAQIKKSHPFTAGKIEKLVEATKKLGKVIDNNKMAVQKTKIMVNVLFASAIACTFLNVVYGKFIKWMDSRGAQKTAQPQENQVKEAK